MHRVMLRPEAEANFRQTHPFDVSATVKRDVLLIIFFCLRVYPTFCIIHKFFVKKYMCTMLFARNS